MTQKHSMPEPSETAQQATPISKSSEKTKTSRKKPILRVGTALLAHWQVLAFGVLLTV
ncbi:hypothetical protein [uncultured Rothia sp.]|uniref:hypothetical protein n=1 Tax=uncultured Rothia sp. TaxID=316088 RepID=UPI003216E45E